MKQKDLFKLALGLEDPWMVRELRFSPEEGRLDVCCHSALKTGHESALENRPT
jgi:hypothetical protein